MSGNYHFGGDPNQSNVNATNAHVAGSFEDTNIPLSRGSFYGPVSNVVAASGNASASYAPYGGSNQNGQHGGRGYGMADVQDLLGGNRYPIIKPYDSVGVNSDLGLDVSRQHNPLSDSKMTSSYMSGGRGNRTKMRAGRRKPQMWGGANLTSYGYDTTKGGNEDLSLYKGSYAPITVSNFDEGKVPGFSNTSIHLGGKGKRGGKKGGKQKTMRRFRYKTKSKNGGRGKSHKHNKYCKHTSRSRRYRKYKKSRNGRGLNNQLKMTKKILEKIVGGNGTCGGPSPSAGPQGPIPPTSPVQSGGYSQYLGSQEFSQGYTLNDLVTPQTSALANPIPFKPYNSCQ